VVAESPALWTSVDRNAPVSRLTQPGPASSEAECTVWTELQVHTASLDGYCVREDYFCRNQSYWAFATVGSSRGVFGWAAQRTAFASTWWMSVLW